MTVSVKVVGVKSEIANLEEEVVEEATKELHRNAIKAFAGIKRATPVDTGRARNSWFLDRDKTSVTFTNNVDYIKPLNEGHSKQAPPRFIEQVIFRFLGVIPQVKYFKK